jgi:hypothetical protein
MCNDKEQYSLSLHQISTEKKLSAAQLCVIMKAHSYSTKLNFMKHEESLGNLHKTLDIKIDIKMDMKIAKYIKSKVRQSV